jgi:hypothetical protein
MSVRKFLIASVLVIASPVLAMTQAEVNDTLRDDTEIYNGLFAIAVADQVRKNCDDVSARLWRAYLFARSLQSRARDLGFSDDQIDGFIESSDEKARLRTFVTSYFETHGVIESDPETYCALGRTEIENGSQAGALLRAN